MALLRRLIVPLAAAFAAALFAHIGIDVIGDYLLPHDAYDDVAHGSRVLVLAIVAVSLVALAVGALAAAVREARGSVDAFAKSVRSSLTLAFFPTLGVTVVCATLVLMAMECADVRAAGRAIDDLADLFGGSLALGTIVVASASCIFAIGVRALVRALAGAGRVLVRAIVTVFALRSVRRSASSQARDRNARHFAQAPVDRTSISGRAPPRRPLARPR